jgi:hypothetical protein
MIKPLALASGHGRYRYITATVNPNGRFCPLGNGECPYYNIGVIAVTFSSVCNISIGFFCLLSTVCRNYCGLY